MKPIEITDKVVDLKDRAYHKTGVIIYLQRGSRVRIRDSVFYDGDGGKSHLLLITGLVGDVLRRPRPVDVEVEISGNTFETTSISAFDDLLNLIGVLGRIVKKKPTVRVFHNTFVGPTSKAGCQVIADRFCQNVWIYDNVFRDWTHVAAEIAGGRNNRIFANTALANPEADGPAFYAANFYPGDRWSGNVIVAKGKNRNQVRQV